MQRLTVKRARITDIAAEDVPSPPLLPGQARVALQSFALTANNVTYAASGEAIGYWRFFPCEEEGRGIVPVWGTGVVIETRSEAVREGQRLYGFYPMAEELVMTPEIAAGGAVTDRAPHRADLPPVYNRYYPVAAAPSADDELRAIFQPLLATSWLIADSLFDNDWFGARQIIVGSASSKTGLGLCRFLRDYQDRPFRIVGLTSARNRDFVKGLGYCDEVLTYDAIESLDQEPSVYVDMAGNTEVKRRLHAHLGDALRHSSAVGLSHWNRFQPKADLPGIKPQFFFAPAQAEKRRADWGAAELDRRISEAWRRVAAESAEWMRVERHDGLAEAARVYGELATGRADPRAGHVVRLRA